MQKEFKFPDVGEGITEGTIVEILVREGQSIKKDETIANIETDKAIVEIPSPFEGKILKINFKKGSTVKVGETLIVVETSEGDKKMPDLIVPENKSEKKEKAAVQLEKVQEEKKQVLMPGKPKTIKASPATRKLARELGVELSTVTGSGPGARITDEDVRKAVKKKEVPETAVESIKPAEKGMPEQEKDSEKQAVDSSLKSVSEQPALKTTPVISKPLQIKGKTEKISLTGVRKTISQKMTESKFTAPHVTHIDEADLTELWNVRKKEQRIAEEKGIHLTFLAFVVKAVVAALKKYPFLNSSLDMQKQEIILKKYYNIGIAVETANGLIVPVIKNADKKSILQIAKEIQGLAEKAKNRTLSLIELKASTFTITNVGSIGGLISTPIINYPETAILGFHRIKERPVAVNGKIEIRKMVYLAVSFDHRILDGATVALFLNNVISLLEDPARLLVDVV